MGDTSIIARRLTDGHVQYGWSGNGGYFKNVGLRLLLWYQKPEDVEYLFELGQTGQIGKKGSERGNWKWYEEHNLTGEGFWLGTTERMIFSKLMFIDYGYFYDLDHRWYYIIPGPFRIKMPLELIDHNVDEWDMEFTYIHKIEDRILKYILTEYVQKDCDFQKHLEQKGYCLENVMEDIKEDGLMRIMKFYDNYKKIYEYFDDWILLKTNDTNTTIIDIIVKKREENHIETCNW